jgi:hypothetical protein
VIVHRPGERVVGEDRRDPGKPPRRAEETSMSAVVEAPREMIEAVAALRLPPKGDRRLQTLMDRNTDGTLTPEEREELESLVELSETIALVRAQALRLLGRKPA